MYEKLSDIPLWELSGYSVNTSIFNPLSLFRDKYIETGLFDINPPYQRGYVWTTYQKAKYMEHVISGGQTGLTLFFNCPNWYIKVGDTQWHNTVEVLDGKQRISAMQDFVRDEFKVFGRYFSEFEDTESEFNGTERFSGLKWYRITLTIFCLKTKEKVVDLYLRMNAGESTHTETDLQAARDYYQSLIK